MFSEPTNFHRELTVKTYPMNVSEDRIKTRLTCVIDNEAFLNDLHNVRETRTTKAIISFISVKNGIQRTVHGPMDFKSMQLLKIHIFLGPYTKPTN